MEKTSQTQQEAGRTFTQEEVNRIVQDRLAKKRRAQSQPASILEALAKPIVDYLKENHNRYCTAVITRDSIRLVQDELSIPVKTATN